MINLETFCPFERVIALFVRIAIKNKSQIKRVEVEFDGFRSFSIAITDKTDLYFAAGYTLGERKTFMQTPSVTGFVKFLMTEGRYKTNSFTVNHNLYKEPELVSEFKNLKPVANTVGKIQTFHPEALELSIQTGDITFDNGELESDFVPFYNYVLLNPRDVLSGGELTIFGPALSVVKHKFGDVTTPVSTVSVYLNDKPPVIDVKEIEEVKEEVRVNHLFRTLVNIEVDGVLHPFELTQNGFTEYDSWSDFEYIYKLLMTECYLELLIAKKLALPDIVKKHAKDGLIVFKGVRSGDALVLENDFNLLFGRYVRPSQTIRDLFDKIWYTNDGLSYRDEGGDVYFSSKFSNQACFALSMSRFISYMFDGSWFTTISALNQLIQYGGLKSEYSSDVKRKILIGHSDVVFDNTTRVFEGLFGANYFTGSLIRSTDLPQTEGYCIVGFDPFDSNKDPSAPDHYVVCYHKNGRLYNVYDPFWRGGTSKRGADVTNIFFNTAENNRAVYKFPDAKIISALNGEVDYVARS